VSFPRKRESSVFRFFGLPLPDFSRTSFAGVTDFSDSQTCAEGDAVRNTNLSDSLQRGVLKPVGIDLSLRIDPKPDSLR
jgi:hypothetical protein